MMSLFSILIVFMLKNFTTQPEVGTTSEKFKLPVSTALKVPEPALKIVLTADYLLVDDMILMEIGIIRKQKKLLINPLYSALNKNRERAELISRSNKNLTFKGNVLMQSDRNIDFSVIKKVMYTTGQAGYETINMVVITKE